MSDNGDKNLTRTVRQYSWQYIENRYCPDCETLQNHEFEGYESVVKSWERELIEWYKCEGTCDKIHRLEDLFVPDRFADLIKVE